MTTPPVSLAQLRAFMNFDDADTSEDAELIDMLAAAAEQVEAVVGPMTAQSVTATVYGSNGMITLPTPLISVDSLAFDGGDPFDLTGLNIDLEAGVISSRYGYALASWWWETPNVNSRPFTVTYTAGRTPVPTSLMQATMIVAEQLFKTQRGGSAQEPVVMGYVWPHRAVELVAPYRRYAFA